MIHCADVGRYCFPIFVPFHFSFPFGTFVHGFLRRRDCEWRLLFWRARLDTG